MSQVRRVAIAVGSSAAMVVLLAALLPRAYLVNDDPGFVMYLRLGAYTQWISPVLNRALVSLYHMAPGVPWYGLYSYALIIATGAVLIHTCLELVDRQAETGRVAMRLGALVLVASHVILIVGITWTTVSIAALGTAMVAFVAHLQTCQATKTPASPVRALVLGLLFVAGFALREAAVFAMAAALLPLLGWVTLQFVRSRYLPRPAALFAFIAPFAIIFAVQNRIPQSPGSGPEYEEFNQVRGRISEAAAFANLDKRAPALLERAGWTLDDYYDFANWLLADDTQFTTEKVKRLADTGGVPTSMTVADGIEVLRGIANHSGASVWLFLSIAIGGLLLAWLGVVDRGRALWFIVGNVAFLTVVPVVMAAISRFPQRIALQFYTIAAFGIFVVLAHEAARRAPREVSERRGRLAVIVFALVAFVWARNLFAWADREPWPYHPTLERFAERVRARNGMLMVAVGITEMDPLLPDPRGYDSLPSGWGTFTYPWFEYIHRFGIKSGSEFLHKMVDNPDAYVIATPYGHEGFEDWMRRRVGNPAIRMALIDSAAGMPASVRSELYHLVTTPLVRGSEEWQLLAHNYTQFDGELPGPPDVGDRAFRSITFAAPYDRYSAPTRRTAPGTAIAPIDGGLRCTVSDAEGGACTSTPTDGDYAGIQIPVDGLGAARFEVTLTDPENILGLYVYAMTDTSRSIRWRWELDALARQFGFTGTFTLVPGYPAHRLELVESTADPRDIRNLDVVIAVKPGTHAGFELHRVEVAAP